MRKSILVVDESLDDCRRVARVLKDPMTEVLSALSTDGGGQALHQAPILPGHHRRSHLVPFGTVSTDARSL